MRLGWSNRVQWLGGGVLLSLLAGGAVLWLNRAPIARHYVDRYLADHDVDARYQLTELGFGRQRIVNVRLGDPASPDLTARSIDLQLKMGLFGIKVVSIDADGVRLKARVIDGRLSMGDVDKLLPQSGDSKAFSLPDIRLGLRDAKMSAVMPMGQIDLVAEGAGLLSNGFSGVVTAQSSALQAGGCGLQAVRARLTIDIAEGRPMLAGPVRAASVNCPGSRLSIAAPMLTLNASSGVHLARWSGEMVLESGAARVGEARLAKLGGRIGFDSRAGDIAGPLSLFGDAASIGGAKAARLAFDGRYGWKAGPQRAELIGDVALSGGAIAPDAIAGLSRKAQGLADTPVGPVLRALTDAAIRAGRAFDGRALVSVRHRQGTGGEVRIERVDAQSVSGVKLLLRGAGPGNGFGLAWPSQKWTANGRLTLGGGGLPESLINLRQARPGDPLAGEARLAPIVANGARFALAPVRFDPRPDGVTHIRTSIMLDGPLADGRVEGLSLPIDLRVRSDGRFALNNQCSAIAFRGLVVAGYRFGAARLPYCPVGGALLARGSSGAIIGGVRFGALNIDGRTSDDPVALSAGSIAFALGSGQLSAKKLAVMIGKTRFALDGVNGRLGARGITGQYDGMAGQIGTVPLLLSEGRGDWALRGGALQVTGAMRVADAQQLTPRFRPLKADGVQLELREGKIKARGMLREPDSGIAVAAVTLRHDLARGAGDAALTVDDLRFDFRLQPERITPLTLGIVANVMGSINGTGVIRWNDRGVTSTGQFGTESMDLAAAFGPVTGLKGQIRFTDLLGMVTAPDQVVTIKEANPGIAVRDGVIRYRLLANQQVAITSGAWPFSGGTLSLDPALIDMGQPVARKLTFRIVGLDSAAFLQQLEFHNLAVTGRFDGVLPIIFDASGGRIEGGRLSVRPEGGTLAYVGDVTNANLGKFARLAFDALKSMRYQRLMIELNGSLDGEIVSRIIFDGSNVSTEKKKRGGLLGPLMGLPFRFNISITAPFRGLVNSAQTFVDPMSVLRQQGITPAPPPVMPPTIIPPPVIQPQ